MITGSYPYYMKSKIHFIEKHMHPKHEFIRGKFSIILCKFPSKKGSMIKNITRIINVKRLSPKMNLLIGSNCNYLLSLGFIALRWYPVCVGFNIIPYSRANSPKINK